MQNHPISPALPLIIFVFLVLFVNESWCDADIFKRYMLLVILSAKSLVFPISLMFIVSSDWIQRLRLLWFKMAIMIDNECQQVLNKIWRICVLPVPLMLTLQVQHIWRHTNWFSVWITPQILESIYSNTCQFLKVYHPPLNLFSRLHLAADIKEKNNKNKRQNGIPPQRRLHPRERKYT